MHDAAGTEPAFRTKGDDMNTTRIRTSAFVLAMLAVPMANVAWGAGDGDFIGGVPRMEVTLEGDLRVQARGFAEAFAQIPAGAKFIWIRNGDETIILGSVESVKAVGGVIVIQIDSGPTHIVSADNVIQITNERPKQTPK
jgi:hypothetical protein